jgi:hypothetical protein
VQLVLLVRLVPQVQLVLLVRLVPQVQLVLPVLLVLLSLFSECAEQTARLFAL